MKAAVLDNFGDATALEIRDIEKPKPGPGQILVKVHSTNVNPIDWKMRNGWMAMRYGEEFPMILGWDCSGVVEETGADVTGFKPGDEVMARSDIETGKCYAEYALINITTAVHKPDNLNQEEAGAIPLTGLTAINSLINCAELQAGQRVLVVGGSGGVGTLAIQIAKNLGAHVTAVASTKNLELCRTLGADEVIDYTQSNPLETDTPYDVIYDTVCAHEFDKAKASLSEEGVFLTLSPAPGVDFFIPGQTEREPGKGYFIAWAPTAADLQKLADWAAQGQLKVVIDSTYSLSDIQEAHLRSETERCVGKIVINVAD